jgi:amidohydrolase
MTETRFDPDEIDLLVDGVLPGVITLRHEIHAHPETALAEFETRENLKSFLGGGFVYREALLGTDLIFEIPARGPGPGSAGFGCITLRADMDALPLTEETRLPWASVVPGRMHACGHDGHMAVLAGTARVLETLRDQLPRTVRFVFQPGEEVVGAGRELADLGAYDGAGSAYALHGWPGLPLGAVALKEGAYFGASHNFHAVIRGLGGHGAYPELAVNPLPAAAGALLDLEALHNEVFSSRGEVVSGCSINGGSAANVIPDVVIVRGTVRYLDPKRGEELEESVRSIFRRRTGADGIRVDMEYNKTYDVPVNNDPDCCRRVRRAAAAGNPEITVVEETVVERGSEDFAFALRKVPGCLFKLGLGDSVSALHSSTFDFPDNALRTGILMMVRLALGAGNR